MRTLWLLTGLAVVQSCSSTKVSSEPQPSHYRLFILTQLQGELEPCGCSLEPLGGLARLATYLDQHKDPAQTPVLIAHGDLISPGKVSVGSVPQIRKAGEFLQRQLLGLGLVISGFGEDDEALERDAKALRTVTETPWLERDALRTAQGIQFVRGRITQKLDPKRPVVMLFDGDLKEAKAQAAALQAAGVDLVIPSKPHEEPAISELAEGLYALVGGERGQKLLDVTLTWRGGSLIRLEGAGERQAALDAMQARIEGLVKQRDRAKVRQKPPALLAARTAQVERAKAQRKRLLETPLPKPPEQGSSLSGQRVPLDSSIAQNETMNQAIQSHHRAISTLNKQLESTRQCPQTDAPDQAQYVGSVACQGCHQEAYALWKKTPHAQAWATLEQKGRTYDYTCVGCHSAGFEQPGGFCRVSEAGARVNVGCESCHGPGSLHIAQAGKGPIKRKVSAEDCTQCHHPPHTNTFVYEDRLQRVLGPGHQAAP